MPRLYFIRHGETDWNREGRLQGRTETALNPRGRRQASKVAAHLAALLAGRGAPSLATLPFYASPMIRTRQTVEILREALDLPSEGYTADERLREMGFGAWEGHSWPEIRLRDPIGSRERDRDRWSFEPPGGESYAMVAARVRPLLDSLDHDACIVSHGGVARAMMVLCGGICEANALNADVWQGKILLMENDSARWLPGPGRG